MGSEADIACCYAALILADDDVAITDDKIATLLKAAKVDFEAYLPGLYATNLANCNVKELCFNIGSSAGSAAPAAGGAGAAADAGGAPAAEEKKKEEESEESDDDMGLDLFG